MSAERFDAAVRFPVREAARRHFKTRSWPRRRWRASWVGTWPTGPDVIAVSPGQDASACAIHADGSVVCWGEGYSPTEAPNLPVAVSFETASPPSEVAVYGISGSADDWGDDDCVIRRGCTLRPSALPSCAHEEAADSGAHDTSTWSELAGSAGPHEGQIVRVRGSLGVRGGPMSLVACFAPGGGKPACCNGSTGTVILDGVPVPLNLEGLFCAGDESEMCCNAPAYGQTVVASGRLQRSSSAWTLTDVTLCEPRK